MGLGGIIQECVFRKRARRLIDECTHLLQAPVWFRVGALSTLAYDAPGAGALPMIDVCVPYAPSTPAGRA